MAFIEDINNVFGVALGCMALGRMSLCIDRTVVDELNVYCECLSVPVPWTRVWWASCWPASVPTTLLTTPSLRPLLTQVLTFIYLFTFPQLGTGWFTLIQYDGREDR